MKTIPYISIALLFLLTITSCKKEYEAPGPEANKICIKTPSTFTQIHEPLYFGDLSSGVVKRLWRFPESADVIGSDDNYSVEPIVGATFTEPGFYQVILHMEFADNLIDNGTYTGLKEVDSVIIVEILDSVRATFSANYLTYVDPGNPNLVAADSAEMLIEDNAENEVWAGEYVKFTSSMYGRPSNYVWYFEGGNPEIHESTDSSIIVNYRKLGTFTVAHLVFRENPPSIDTVVIPGLIKVTKTERRAALITALKTDDKTIELEFTLGLKDPGNLAGDFEVLVINDEDGEIPGIEVSNVAVDNDVPSKLILTLNENIYDDDSTYISFNTGTLIDEFDELVPSFSNRKVISVLENVLPDEVDAGFETNPTLWTPVEWGGTIYTPANTMVEISTTTYHSGQSAIKVTTAAGGGSAIQAPGSYAIVEGASYKMSFWMLIQGKGDLNLTGDDRSNAGLYNGDWVNGFSNYLVSTQTAPDGWQYYTHILYPTPADPDVLFPLIRGHNPNSTTPIVFYIDDLTMERFKQRTIPN